MLFVGYSIVVHYPSTPVPSHASRRIVVLVSGLGTASDSNTAWEIDTKSLGYAEADVVRYSYEGGQAPRVSNDQGSTLRSVVSQPLGAITTRPFTATDSQQSVGTSADRLADLLQSVAIAQPGVPIDLVGHSQGGVVARLAVERSGAENRLPSEVETLVTVSSPQQGAPLATGVVALGDTPGGAAALSQVRAAGMADELDNRMPALTDLAETSATMDELHSRPMASGVRFVTIGGSGDLVVPGSSAGDPAADASIILPTPIGKEAHGSLPSTPAATREIGLAVAGMGPTCQSFGVALSGVLTAETIRYGETLASANAAIGAGVLAIPPAD
jgi:pimeloyl-ACP methyl ester carboxylesterase